jgi:hypothetical protein
MKVTNLQRDLQENLLLVAEKNKTGQIRCGLAQ